MRSNSLILRAILLVSGLYLVFSHESAAETVVLVEDGRANAAIVTADDPYPVSRLAAEELAAHIEQSTKVRLPIIPESEAPSTETNARIYIGSTEAAQNLGIDADALTNDTYILRTEGDALYIVGKEDDSEFHESGLNGTLYGVYEALHRYVGVLWVWPGELGTYVPQANTIAIPTTLDEEQPPKLLNRRFRSHHVRNAAEAAANGNAPSPAGLNFSADVVQDYWADKEVFLRRHRMGHSQSRYAPGHRFYGWWEEYGEEHPDWFMMHEDGQRGYKEHVPPYGAATSPANVGMCVSNAELHRYIVEEAWDGGDQLSLGEVDRRGFCQCEDCLAWDGPQPKPGEYPSSVRADYEPQVVSDRYVKFWKTVREMAAEHNPDVTITTFLYWNYFPAPLEEIELGEHFYGEFVPWTGPAAWMPMSEALDAWVREQWLGWYNTGMRLAYRPNMLHGGYVMPYFSTRQAGAFMNFAYEHGLEGVDFDTLFGHWATKGPMLYLYLRLAWEPDADIDKLRREYFSIFGPAETQVERYFDFWEDHSHVIAERAIELAKATPDDQFCPHTGFFATLFPGRSMRSHIEYPPELFEEAAEMLAEALALAQEHERDEYAERVHFLQVGLENARLSSQLWEAYDIDNETPIDEDPERRERTEAVINELIELRQEHEDLYFSDLIHAAQWEPLSDFDGIIH